MLRWFAVLCVVLNVIYFAIHFRADTTGQKTVKSNESSVAPSLIMLDENHYGTNVSNSDVAKENNIEKLSEKAVVDGASVGQKVVSSAVSIDARPTPEVTFPLPESVPREQVKTQSADVGQSCWEIGRFDSEEQGRQLTVKLASINQTLTLQKKAVQGEPDYWVFLGPYANRREALASHRELRSRKIDSFLINEGELENAVSLGLFSKKTGAEVMQQQRQKQGLNAKLRAVPRLRNEWWGVLKASSAQLPDALREKILAVKAESPLEIKSLGCESIANADKLD